LAAYARPAHPATEEAIDGWGIILLAIGGIQLLASFQLYGGRGQILGIFLLTLNLVAQLFFLPVYPFWSIIVMVIDGFAIYGLTVYGEHFGGP
jgi:hypothetical protein